jgi:hypothetical protein
MSLHIEPAMLFKIKAITSYPRELCGSARILIMLKLNKLSHGCEQGAGMHFLHTFKAGRLLKTKEVGKGKR